MAARRLSPLLVAAALAFLASAQAACRGTYTVQWGDYLYLIGMKVGVPWRDIYEANRHQLSSPDLIYYGQVLNIPPCYTDPPGASQPPPAPGCRGTYTVRPGDYLYLIGKKVGVPYQDIYEANRHQLPSPNVIYPGQVLIIPPCYGGPQPQSPTVQPQRPSAPSPVAPVPEPVYVPSAPVIVPTPPSVAFPAPQPPEEPQIGDFVFDPNRLFKPPQVDGPDQPVYQGPGDTSTDGTCATAPYVGDATYYYQGGTTSCGEQFTDGMMVAAISWQIYDRTGTGGNPNKSPSCRRCAEVCGPKGSAVVRITDKCGGCKPGDIDLSPGAFEAVVGSLGIGREPGVVWHYVPC